MMAHHILFVEIYEGESFDRLEDLDRLNQSTAARVRQIDLRDVAGDHCFRIETQPGDEHLHLFRRGVLRLVHDYERIIERAAAHERDRRDLDYIFLEVTIDLLRIQHVVKRVIEWPQVRIDLVLQRSGEKTQEFSGLNRGTRQDD